MLKTYIMACGDVLITLKGINNYTIYARNKRIAFNLAEDII